MHSNASHSIAVRAYDRRGAMADRALLAYAIVVVSGPFQVLIRFLYHNTRNELLNGVVFLVACGALFVTRLRPRFLPPFAHVVCTLTLVFAMAAQSHFTQYEVERMGPLAICVVLVCIPLILPIRVWEELVTIGCSATYLIVLFALRPMYLENSDLAQQLAFVFPLMSIIGLLATKHLEELRLRDHRQRVELAEQKERAERQRARAEALAQDLDAYAHAVAHDLKNPIFVIAGYNDLLDTKLQGSLDDEARELLAATSKGCEKMTQIINELLLLASVRKARTVESEPLDMSKIVAEASQRLTNRIDESGATVVLPAEWPQAVGHPAWVEEIWANYLSNAIKYGGSPPRIELGADHEGGGKVHFWVRDNGEGLNEEQLSRLFEEFSRMEPAKADGHGLGLSIVKRIVEKLGGEVRVTSKVGQGSTFGFTLPAEA